MNALTALKNECFSRLNGGVCACCESEKLSSLVLHHLSYNEKSITYNKFENSFDGRLKYYANLLDEIKQDESNFAVLCMDCHKIIETLLKMEWIDAYNFCNENNGENYRYYDVWNQSYERRVNKKQIGLDDTDFPQPTQLEDFFR